MVNETQSQTEANTAGNTGEGNKSKGLSTIERAEQTAERLAASEKRIDEKIARLEELQADRLLAGSAGGRVEPEPPKPLSSKEYADAVMTGKIKAQ